jgi:hypothetical protein
LLKVPSGVKVAAHASPSPGIDGVVIGRVELLDVDVVLRAEPVGPGDAREAQDRYRCRNERNKPVHGCSPLLSEPEVSAIRLAAAQVP